ncbi:MAG: response regulator transcription factor [Dethiobacter sp.]|jgi:DNA-binding NarL/FixJ family response regulator|nr:response regulator transcription factor [Dethiobacter sp.]
MKIVLVDDHEIVRQGLRALLEYKTKAEVVGEAADGREVLALVERVHPDAVIMDIAMPGLNGLEALIQLKKLDPELKVIILSMHVEEIYVSRALRSGACGYVFKGSAYEDLELALKAAQKNETFLSAAVSQVLINGYLQSCKDDCHLLEHLSSREREILQLLAEGNSRRRIAQMLCISAKTVDRHRDNLKDKLKLKHEEELKEFAKALGLTGP